MNIGTAATVDFSGTWTVAHGTVIQLLGAFAAGHGGGPSEVEYRPEPPSHGEASFAVLVALDPAFGRSCEIGHTATVTFHAK